MFQSWRKQLSKSRVVQDPELPGLLEIRVLVVCGLGAKAFPTGEATAFATTPYQDKAYPLEMHANRNNSYSTYMLEIEQHFPSK